MTILVIKDIPRVEELSDDAARSIVGGRIHVPQVTPPETGTGLDGKFEEYWEYNVFTS